MKPAKRILSVLLALLMLALAVPMAFAEDTPALQVGDHIQFGTYPQTRIDETPELKAAAESATWKSYGYYEGTGNRDDGNMAPCDYMCFADFFYCGSKYRAVRFIKFRPVYTSGTWNDSSIPDQVKVRILDDGTEVTDIIPGYINDQEKNGYMTNTVYYFKYVPLTWRVLDPSACFVMCENLVDSQAYQNTVYSILKDTFNHHPDNYGQNYWHYQDKTQSVYANDYASSSIRTWLNNDFYETAFTADQKANIKTTELDNSAAGTGSAQFDSAATNDKIFLLSDGDIRNTAYGFSSAAETRDAARAAKGTDYAFCQGLVANTTNGSSNWRLRTPTSTSIGTLCVDGDGSTGWYNYVNRIDYGIRPACNLFELTSDVTLSESLFSKGNSSPDPYDLTTEPSAEFSTEPSSEPSTDSDIQPTTVPSTVLTTAEENTSKDTPKPAFIQRIIQWFRDLFAKLFGKK